MLHNPLLHEDRIRAIMLLIAALNAGTIHQHARFQNNTKN